MSFYRFAEDYYPGYDENPWEQFGDEDGYINSFDVTPPVQNLSNTN